MNPNAPAFPQPLAIGSHGKVTPKDGIESGLTIRAEFAKAAMQGMLSAYSGEGVSFPLPNQIAAMAVAQADALITALNTSAAKS